MHPISGLKTLLKSVGPGPIENAGAVESLLIDCWGELDGSRENGMEEYKLSGRMESVEWRPPLLTFTIERHGAIALGGTRAELQHWQVDLDAMTARMSGSGRRQLKPMADRLPVKEMASEIAQAILDGDEHEAVKCLDPKTVRIQTSLIFPTGSGHKKTIEGRRNSLMKNIEDLLATTGWKKLPGRKFSKT